MQYDATTPAEYLELLADDWRRSTLLELRELILAKAPELREHIQYKMLAYSDEAQTVFQLNAQKSYVSLYVGDTKKIDESGEMLTGLNIGKGCIRFAKSKVVKDTRIDEFIERTISLWKKGVDIDC